MVLERRPMLRAALAAALVLTAVSPTVAQPSASVMAERKAAAKTGVKALAPILKTCPAAHKHQLDLTVTKLELDPLAEPMTMNAEVSIAVSDRSGKILYVVAGGAKVEVSGRYKASRLPQLKDDAVEAAVEGMRTKLRAKLAGG